MKTFKLIIQAILIMATMLFFACEGEQGDPGPEGPQGEQGVPGEDGQDGSDGQDGADGQDGNTNSFYFQDGFKGYDGTEDVTIYNQADIFVEEDILEIPSPNSKNLLITVGNQSSNTNRDSIHSLMRFNDLKEEIDGEFETDICSEDFFVNEAVIYLSGLLNNPDNNLLQVGFYGNESSVFDQNFASWEMANETEAWDSIGGKERWEFYDPYFDLVDMGTQFNFGYIHNLDAPIFFNKPIYVPREVAKRWICEEENPGFLLSYLDNDFLSIIYSSENDNQDARPMLYLNVEKNDGSANRQLISDEEAYENWKSKSYQEKMKPFYEAHPELK